MDSLNLDGKNFSFESLGIEFELFMHDGHQCVKIKETSENDFLKEESFAFIDVTSVSNKTRSEDPLEIKDEQNNSLGYLIIGDGKNRSIADLPSLRTAATFYFLLTDQVNNSVNPEEIIAPPDFESSMIIEDRSVLLVGIDSLQSYKETYMSGADLWGGFSHRRMENFEHGETSFIKAVPNISFPTDAHKNKAYYSTSSDNSFTRFLSKYQIIELMFDYITVARIRVSKDNLMEFRDIMSAYGRDDILLLRAIFKNYVLDIPSLTKAMYKFSEFENTTIEIFQKYSKESNPLQNEINFTKFWQALKAEKLTYADLDANPELKYMKLPKNNNLQGNQTFAVSVANIVSYWIYRVRCSIAHNKIGEHIFSDTDELFIVDAAEPLLDEVLRQLLTNNELQELLSKSKQLEDHLNR